MAGADVDEAVVVAEIIDPVWDGLPVAEEGKSWTCTRTGWPFGRQVRPLFLNSPISSFFLVSTEITGWPRSMN
jgi:hypothetical protein